MACARACGGDYGCRNDAIRLGAPKPQYGQQRGVQRHQSRLGLARKINFTDDRACYSKSRTGGKGKSHNLDVTGGSRVGVRKPVFLVQRSRDRAGTLFLASGAGILASVELSQ